MKSPAHAKSFTMLKASRRRYDDYLDDYDVAAEDIPADAYVYEPRWRAWVRRFVFRLPKEWEFNY